MRFNKYASLGVCLTMLVLTSGVFAVEEIDETLYRFLASHYVPPPACPENEAWHECLRDCSDCARRGRCRVEGCARKGCDCQQNFVRLTTGGPCVPVHECPQPKCGENESFRECGPLCEVCGGLRCTLLQCGHRCYCNQGHLRKNEGGKCVPEEQCPNKIHCYRNEEQKKSGRKDEYCLRDENEKPSNVTETKDRCYCKEGFSRNTMGHCVEDKYCAMTHCFLGEVYQSCPRKCNATCRTYGDASCEEDGQCFPGCFCAEGTHMDDMQRCVTLEQCPTGSNPFVPTAGPTSTPTMTPSTENEAPGSNPTTAQISDSTVENYGDTSGLSTEGEERSVTTSTTTVTSQATAQDGSETSEKKDELKDIEAGKDVSANSTSERDVDGDKDQDADSTKDQDASSTEDQDANSTEDQNADTTNDQDADSTKDQDTDSTKDQDADSTKDQDTDSTKDQDADSTKDQESDKTKDQSVGSAMDPAVDEPTFQLETSSIAFSKFQEYDEDEDEFGEEVQKTTTVQPKSSKKPGKDKKMSTMTKKATTPVDMDEENE